MRTRTWMLLLLLIAAIGCGGAGGAGGDTFSNSNTAEGQENCQGCDNDPIFSLGDCDQCQDAITGQYDAECLVLLHCIEEED